MRAMSVNRIGTRVGKIVVIGNAAGNNRAANKSVDRKDIVYMTDDGTTPLACARIAFNNQTLTSCSTGYTDGTELPSAGSSRTPAFTVAGIPMLPSVGTTVHFGKTDEE